MTSRETLHQAADNLPDSCLDQALQSLLRFTILPPFIPKPLARWKIAVFLLSLATAVILVVAATHRHPGR
jgi:hypothetical protein